MFTNGIIYWLDQFWEIKKLKSTQPFYISDIILSEDNSRLIVYCSLENQESEVVIKIFNYDSAKRVFVVDNNIAYNKQAKNITFNDDPETVGEDLLEISIELKRGKLKSKIY